MDDRDALLARIAKLEALVRDLTAKVEEKDRLIAAQAGVIAAHAARVAELEAELRRRGKKFVPKANAPARPPKPDRRTVEFRKHPGQARREPPLTEDVIHHDVHVERCPGCGGEMTPTGDFTDHIVEDIPEPKVEVHRFR